MDMRHPRDGTASRGPHWTSHCRTDASYFFDLSLSAPPKRRGRVPAVLQSATAHRGELSHISAVITSDQVQVPAARGPKSIILNRRYSHFDDDDDDSPAYYAESAAAVDGGDRDDGAMAWAAEGWEYRSELDSHTHDSAGIPSPMPTLEVHDPLGTKPQGPAGVRGAGEHSDRIGLSPQRDPGIHTGEKNIITLKSSRKHSPCLPSCSTF